MAAIKGSEKTGGRKKGTPNKITSEFRNSLALAMSGHIEKIPKYIDDIEDKKDKLDAIAKFMPYIMPKLQTTTVKGDGEGGEIKISAEVKIIEASN